MRRVDPYTCKTAYRVVIRNEVDDPNVNARAGDYEGVYQFWPKHWDRRVRRGVVHAVDYVDPHVKEECGYGVHVWTELERAMWCLRTGASLGEGQVAEIWRVSLHGFNRVVPTFGQCLGRPRPKIRLDGVRYLRRVAVRRRNSNQVEFTERRTGRRWIQETGDGMAYCTGETK